VTRAEEAYEHYRKFCAHIGVSPCSMPDYLGETGKIAELNRSDSKYISPRVFALGGTHDPDTVVTGRPMPPKITRAAL
jgi:hypothetical protein